jgi:hypothetical protein
MNFEKAIGVVMNNLAIIALVPAWARRLIPRWQRVDDAVNTALVRARSNIFIA